MDKRANNMENLQYKLKVYKMEPKSQLKPQQTKWYRNIPNGNSHPRRKVTEGSLKPKRKGLETVILYVEKLGKAQQTEK